MRIYNFASRLLSNLDVIQEVKRTAKLNMSVLHFLAECGLPPSIIDRPAFKEMMMVQAQVGSSAKIGNAKQCKVANCLVKEKYRDRFGA